MAEGTQINEAVEQWPDDDALWPDRHSGWEMRRDYTDRVEHLYSELRTSDDELSYARTIQDELELVEIATDAEQNCEVTLYSKKLVYHFYQFRTHYEGHSSRALIQLLDHFDINLPLDFLIRNQTMKIYLSGVNDKIVVSDGDEEREYRLEFRLGKISLIEKVDWFLSINTLNMLYEIAAQVGLENRPDLIVEEIVANEVRRAAEMETPETHEEEVSTVK